MLDIGTVEVTKVLVILPYRILSRCEGSTHAPLGPTKQLFSLAERT